MINDNSIERESPKLVQVLGDNDTILINFSLILLSSTCLLSIVSDKGDTSNILYIYIYIYIYCKIKPCDRHHRLRNPNNFCEHPIAIARMP